MTKSTLNETGESVEGMAAFSAMDSLREQQLRAENLWLRERLRLATRHDSRHNEQCQCGLCAAQSLAE